MDKERIEPKNILDQYLSVAEQYLGSVFKEYSWKEWSLEIKDKILNKFITNTGNHSRQFTPDEVFTAAEVFFLKRKSALEIQNQLPNVPVVDSIILVTELVAATLPDTLKNHNLPINEEISTRLSGILAIDRPEPTQNIREKIMFLPLTDYSVLVIANTSFGVTLKKISRKAADEFFLDPEDPVNFSAGMGGGITGISISDAVADDDLYNINKAEALAYPLLTPEGELVLLLRKASGDVVAKERIFRSNMLLVISSAIKYCRRTGMWDLFFDLLQEGYVGLEVSLGKFDSRRKNRFSTYAVWWINQYQSRYVEIHIDPVRKPLLRSPFGSLVRRTIKELADKYHDPTDEEIMLAILDDNSSIIGKDTYNLLLQISTVTNAIRNSTLSLDKIITEGSEETHQDSLTDKQDSPEDAVQTIFDDEFSTRILEEMLNKLTPDEKLVIMLRRGLTDGKEYSLKEVAAIKGVSHARIGQIEKYAMRKLKWFIEKYREILREIYG